MISAAVSNSSAFDSCDTSPVWITSAGGFGSLAMRSSAACSVAFGSGFASLLKPMLLSLIWTKVNPSAGAAFAALVRLNPRGTPPTTLHTMPVPAQAMHLSSPRRFGFTSRSSVIAPSLSLTVERKAQGEASALISTVRKAPQPSAGKQGTSTRRFRPERPTVRRLLSRSTAFRRRFDKGGHRRIAEPFFPQRVVGAVLVDLADEAIEPHPPPKLASPDAHRALLRRPHRPRLMVLPALAPSTP